MASAPIRMGHDDTAGRDLYLLELPTAADVPAAIGLPARHFLCLVGGALHRRSDAEVHRLARALLEAGAVYLSVWGPSAERVHALLRDAVLIAERSQAEETVVMTSAHDGPVEDALVFLLADAVPSTAYADACRAALVVLIDAPDAAAVVRAALTAPAEFLARMTTTDDG